LIKRAFGTELRFSLRGFDDSNNGSITNKRNVITNQQPATQTTKPMTTKLTMTWQQPATEQATSKQQASKQQPANSQPNQAMTTSQRPDHR
jgi:hypothetical protein